MLPEMYISWCARSSVLWRCLSKCTSYREMSDSTELSTCKALLPLAKAWTKVWHPLRLALSLFTFFHQILPPTFGYSLLASFLDVSWNISGVQVCATKRTGLSAGKRCHNYLSKISVVVKYFSEMKHALESNQCFFYFCLVVSCQAVYLVCLSWAAQQWCRVALRCCSSRETHTDLWLKSYNQFSTKSRVP